MKDNLIEESGMFFKCEESNCFPIEKSAIYHNLKKDVKIAELLIKKQDKLFIIEAKSSSPRSNNQQRFNEFIQEIHEKLFNALSLHFALCLGRHALEKQDLFPESFKNMSLSTIDFKLLLIIKGHKKEWLIPLNDALKKSFFIESKIWALSPTAITVINDEMARQYGLIL